MKNQSYGEVVLHVYALLTGTDKDNKIPLRRLCRWTHASPSTVKRAIKLLRADGAPIGSDTAGEGGYWWVSKDEAADEIVKLDMQINQLIDRQNALVDYFGLGCHIIDYDDGLMGKGDFLETFKNDSGCDEECLVCGYCTTGY